MPLRVAPPEIEAVIPWIVRTDVRLGPVRTALPELDSVAHDNLHLELDLVAGRSLHSDRRLEHAGLLRFPRYHARRLVYREALRETLGRHGHKRAGVYPELELELRADRRVRGGLGQLLSGGRKAEHLLVLGLRDELRIDGRVLRRHLDLHRRLAVVVAGRIQCLGTPLVLEPPCEHVSALRLRLYRHLLALSVLPAADHRAV